MKKPIFAVCALALAVSCTFAGCGGNNNQRQEPVSTTSFEELRSYYDELAKGEIKQEIATTEARSKYYSFEGDENLLPPGVYDKLEDIVYKTYSRIYGKYGTEYTTPKITIYIDAAYSGKGANYTSGKKIYINPNWFVDNPDDYDSIISALMGTVQSYNASAPDWLKSSIKAYVRDQFRSSYADKNWFVTTSYEGVSYEEGDVHGAAFLKWINSTTDTDFVYRLNRALQDGSYKEEFWKDETGLTLGQLWASFQKNS
ncbi:MAG: hypothetical protein IKK09_00865 [Clostridia bacterium]|nr:hypothetical protein [Clostridia bacterium]